MKSATANQVQMMDQEHLSGCANKILKSDTAIFASKTAKLQMKTAMCFNTVSNSPKTLMGGQECPAEGVNSQVPQKSASDATKAVSENAPETSGAPDNKAPNSQVAGSSPPPKKKLTPEIGGTVLAKLWRERSSKSLPEFTPEERARLTNIYRRSPDHAEDALGAVLDDWSGFCKRALADAGWHIKPPKKPQLWYVQKHLPSAVEFAHEKRAQTLKSAKAEITAPSAVEVPASAPPKSALLLEFEQRLAECTAEFGKISKTHSAWGCMRQVILNLRHALPLLMQDPTQTEANLVAGAGPLNFEDMQKFEENDENLLKHSYSKKPADIAVGAKSSGHSRHVFSKVRD